MAVRVYIDFMMAAIASIYTGLSMDQLMRDSCDQVDISSLSEGSQGVSVL